MTYSNLIKTGLGVGLLAVSLGADASAIDGKHSFGSTSIYVRSSSTSTNYTAFLPSGNQSTDSVIVVEHMQGAVATSPQTWTYMVPVATLGGLSGYSPATNIIPTGSLIGSIFSPSSSTWAIQSGSVTSSTASVSRFAFDLQGMGFISSVTIGSSSYTNGVWDVFTPIAYPFSYTASVSSSQCNVTAIAVIDQNDYLQWGGIVAQAVAYRTASSPVLVVWTNSSSSKSGALTYTTTSYLQNSATYGSNAWNALVSASSTWPTWSSLTNATVIMHNSETTGSTWSIPYSFGATSMTVGTSTGAFSSPAASVSTSYTTGYFSAPATMLKTQTACYSLYTARASLNTTNLLIGGRNGLMRLW